MATKKAKKSAKKDFPATLMVVQRYDEYSNETYYEAVTDKDDLCDGDRVATYQVTDQVGVVRVKTETSIE